MTLLRYTTTNFRDYSVPLVTLNLRDNTEGSPTLKSITRNTRNGQTVLFSAEPSPKAGYRSFISNDAGRSWSMAKCTTGCVNHPDKDDLNLIFSGGRYVDMQIFWRQNVSMRYCDSDPCSIARAVTTKTSVDGINWSEDAADPILPDSDDPPDLQFYRTRPFHVGNTSRLAAHTLLYSPGPPLSIVGPTWGRQPLKCKVSKVLGEICHGPHIQEEWWVGPKSGDAADTSGWRRSLRGFKAAPHDAFLMAQPATYMDKHVWIGSTGLVYSLPLYRIAGLYTISNAEMSTAVLTLPSQPLVLNADVHWKGGTTTHGCDEGCAAYVFVELVDPGTGVAVAGFSRYNFST